MSVDLGAARTVVPTHYCLHNDEYGGVHALRNWTLSGGQGRRRGGRGLAGDPHGHDNDETLATRKYAVGAWPVAAGGRAFRHLRIRQHCKNASGSNDYLHCCGFEVHCTAPMVHCTAPCTTRRRETKNRCPINSIKNSSNNPCMAIVNTPFRSDGNRSN